MDDQYKSNGNSNDPGALLYILVVNKINGIMRMISDITPSTNIEYAYLLLYIMCGFMFLKGLSLYRLDYKISMQMKSD